MIKNKSRTCDPFNSYVRIGLFLDKEFKNADNGRNKQDRSKIPQETRPRFEQRILCWNTTFLGLIFVRKIPLEVDRK